MVTYFSDEETETKEDKSICMSPQSVSTHHARLCHSHIRYPSVAPLQHSLLLLHPQILVHK